MSAFASTLFKYRSYTPVPFVLVMFFYHNANIWSLIGGFIPVVTGELIRLWGVSWAGSETRTTGSVGSSYLVISGPFAYVRNPLYVGNILIYTGLGVMSFALFPYFQIAGLLFFSIQYHLIVKEEELYLHNTYGADYDDYVKNVPRFFPRFTPYKKENLIQPSFSLKSGLRSEKRSLQAIVFIIITLLLLWFLRRL